MSKTYTPRGLEKSGRALWRSVVDEFELEKHEELVLLEACRVADRLDRLATEASEKPLVVTNFRGDETTHPLLVEARQQAITLTRLIASLRMPGGDEDARPQRRGAARGAYVRALG